MEINFYGYKQESKNKCDRYHKIEGYKAVSMNMGECGSILLIESLSAWGSAGFKSVAKEEIGRIDASCLPLQQCLASTSVALSDGIDVMILNAFESDTLVLVKVGIFFSGVVAGCSCADDPTPVESQTEYCELLFEIDKDSAQATVKIVDDTGSSG